MRDLRSTFRRFLAPLGVAFLVCATGGMVYAQMRDLPKLYRPRNEDRPIRFGISISLNVMDFRVLNTGAAMVQPPFGDTLRYFATTHRLHPGFNVNALMRLRFTDNMHLRFLPGICFGQRDLYYYRDEFGAQRGQREEILPIESSYIEMPILFCYSARRVSNARPYVCVGVNPRLDLAAFKKLKVENRQVLRLQRFDVAYEIGFGYEFYFPYFKMAPEIKWSGGFLNALSKEYAEGSEHYHAALKSLTSQIFIFSLIFE